MKKKSLKNIIVTSWIDYKRFDTLMGNLRLVAPHPGAECLLFNSPLDGSWWLETEGLKDEYIQSYFVRSLRPYSCIMYDRLNATYKWINSLSRKEVDVYYDSPLFNIDDDYAFNPRAFHFAKRIFEEYSDINFLCLLKHPNSDSGSERTMLGHRFRARTSCMGGSIIARGGILHKLAMEFFYEYKVTSNEPGSGGMFDQEFFVYLDQKKETVGNDINLDIWMLQDYSLMQHCNLVSSYLKDKGPRGIKEHMYGSDYDPLVNPFVYGGCEELENE